MAGRPPRAFWHQHCSPPLPVPVPQFGIDANFLSWQGLDSINTEVGVSQVHDGTVTVRALQRTETGPDVAFQSGLQCPGVSESSE